MHQEEDRIGDSFWVAISSSEWFNFYQHFKFKIPLIKDFLIDMVKEFNVRSSPLLKSAQKHRKKIVTQKNVSVETSTCSFIVAKVRDFLYGDLSIDKQYYCEMNLIENDNILKTLESIPPESWNRLLSGGDDNDTDVASYIDLYPSLRPSTISFFYEVLKIPEWVNWKLIKLGQETFTRYSINCSMGLLFYSLIGGFSSPKIVQLLYTVSDLTNQSLESSWLRLIETREMVLDIMEESDSLKPGNKGWIAVVRARLIHSAVRHHVKTCSSNTSGHAPISTSSSGSNKAWDANKHGLPINQHDLVCTLIAFSYNIIVIMKYLGSPLSEYEEHAYLHLWRYVGYLIGVSDRFNPCKSMERAKYAFVKYVEPSLGYNNNSNIVSNTNFNSNSGKKKEQQQQQQQRLLRAQLLQSQRKAASTLAKRILHSACYRKPFYWTYSFQSELTRAFLGSTAADYLELEVSIKQRIYVYLFITALRIWSFCIASWLNPQGKILQLIKKRNRVHVDYYLRKSTSGSSSNSASIISSSNIRNSSSNTVGLDNPNTNGGCMFSSSNSK